MEKTKLSVVVKALRKEYGLTQEDLAMKSGVGLCFVRNLEQGANSPGPILSNCGSRYFILPADFIDF